MVGGARPTSRRWRRWTTTRCGSATSATTPARGTRSGWRRSRSARRTSTPRSPSYELVYPDGARDAESLLAHPVTGRLYVASKEIFGGLLYEAPAELDPKGPNRLRELGEVLPIATDAAFFPDGRHLVVRSYDRARIYGFPSLEPVADLDLPQQKQGEGIAVTADGDLLVSTEGQNTEVLRVAAARVRAGRGGPATADADSEPTPSRPRPSPSASDRPDTASREGQELPETTETVAQPLALVPRRLHRARR